MNESRSWEVTCERRRGDEQEYIRAIGLTDHGDLITGLVEKICSLTVSRPDGAQLTEEQASQMVVNEITKRYGDFDWTVISAEPEE